MKIIKVNEECSVPSEARLIGFVFETEEDYLINIHPTDLSEEIVNS